MEEIVESIYKILHDKIYFNEFALESYSYYHIRMYFDDKIYIDLDVKHEECRVMIFLDKKEDIEMIDKYEEFLMMWPYNIRKEKKSAYNCYYLNFPKNAMWLELFIYIKKFKEEK